MKMTMDSASSDERHGESIPALVTVVIPTRNRLPLLERALASVLNQDHPAVEIIVVDDASTDGTPDALAALEGRITYIRNEFPVGAAVSRNRGISVANGEFITFLDDDDEFIFNRISLLLSVYIEGHAFVASRFLMVDKFGKRLVGGYAGQIFFQDILMKNRVANTFLTTTAKIKKINGFDEALPSSQDTDILARLTRDYGSAISIDDPLYIVHVDHIYPRITSSPLKFRGHFLFYKKYKRWMTVDARKYRLFELLQYRGKGMDIFLIINLVPVRYLPGALRYFFAKRFPILRKINSILKV